MTDCYCISLRKAARKVSSLYDDALAPVGINIGQLSMLRRIKRAGDVSLTELARLCDLDRSTVGRNVKVLERMRLVRTTAGEDHREAMLALTEAGERVLVDGAPLWDAAQSKIEHALGSRDAARLLDLLQGL
jgi:DNA-binding MarR family transcriptional regulator